MRATGKGIVLVDSGTLEAVPGTTPKVAFTIRSLESSFLDLDGNLRFDPTTEKRDHYNVAAAIEGPAYRAVVFADTDLFADMAVNDGSRRVTIMTSGPLFEDVILWLSRVEVFIEDPVTPEAPAESKERTAALLELAQRAVVRALAAAIAAPAKDRARTVEEVRALQDKVAKLRSR